MHALGELFDITATTAQVCEGAGNKLRSGQTTAIAGLWTQLQPAAAASTPCIDIHQYETARRRVLLEYF